MQGGCREGARRGADGARRMQGTAHEGCREDAGRMDGRRMEDARRMRGGRAEDAWRTQRAEDARRTQRAEDARRTHGGRYARRMRGGCAEEADSVGGRSRHLTPVVISTSPESCLQYLKVSSPAQK